MVSSSFVVDHEICQITSQLLVRLVDRRTAAFLNEVAPPVEALLPKTFPQQEPICTPTWEESKGTPLQLTNTYKIFRYSCNVEVKTRLTGPCVVNVLCFFTRTTKRSCCFVQLLNSSRVMLAIGPDLLPLSMHSIVIR